MSAFHSAATDVQRRADDLVNSKGLGANGCTDDIDDRVDRANLVEVDLFDGHVVNLGFGSAECFEDRDCRFLG